MIFDEDIMSYVYNATMLRFLHIYLYMYDCSTYNDWPAGQKSSTEIYIIPVLFHFNLTNNTRCIFILDESTLLDNRIRRRVTRSNEYARKQ